MKKEGDNMTNSKRVPNRLIHEKSPYLLQHAYNPVNWYPWGEEALNKYHLIMHNNQTLVYYKFFKT